MATTYLSKTQVTGTSTRKMTISAWVKIADPSVAYAAGAIWSMGSDSSNFIELQFNDANRLELRAKNSGSYVLRKATAALFKDTSAWYHIVVGVDSDQVSGPDRNKIYINGVQYAGTWDTDTDATINTDFKMNSSSEDARCGRDFMSGASDYFDGEMAHVHYIDGTQYAASDFGETDATSGIWVAKTDPSVTYGNNGGFYKFASGASGADSSGNGNTMAVSGTLTNLKDNPDNNYATWNPLYMPTSDFPVFTNANTTLESQDGSGDYWGSGSTLGMTTGKWYAEFKVIGSSTNKPSFGITQSPGKHAYDTNWIGNKPYDYVYLSTGEKVSNDVPTSSWGDTFTTDDIIGVAVDLDNNKIYFAKNGTWQASGDPTSGSTGTGAAYTITSVAASDMTGDNAEGAYYFAFSDQSTGSATTSANFGNGYFGTTVVSSAGTSSSGDDSIWEYDCPTGYYGLNSTNLATYG